MSDQHQVDERSTGCSSEGISNVQDRRGGASQNNGSKVRQGNEGKPKEVETGEENVDSDGIGVEPLLSPGIQEEASIEGNSGAKKPRPDGGLKTGNDPFNYEEKYPEDKIYEETAPNARVWRTYVDESTTHDVRIVRESRDTVDVLLVFAGLFSAVVTTFVSQTYQNLQADYGQVSASLLFEMVLIQRAIANGSSIDNVPPSSLNPYIQFTPATTDIWVNGLWFTSLSLSLSTALVAVLVKQWLHHYLALPSGTPRERSHVRQYRYGGFQKWHVLVIVGLLPVLMHLALGIFFIGLTVFLVPLRPGLSWVIGVGTVAAYTAYLITIFLPVLYPQCPYRTPLSDLVYFPYHYITQHLFPKHVRPLFVKKVQQDNFTLDKPRAKISSLDDLERRAVQDESTILSVEALHWLFSSSSNPTVHSIVIESIGGLPLSAMAAVKKVFGKAEPIREAHWTLFNDSIQYSGGNSMKPSPGMVSKLERLLRFELFIPYLYTYTENSRFYIDVADDDKGLTVAVQSNSSIQGSRWRPPNSPSSTGFFRQIIFSDSLEVPPVVWLGLMRTAKDDGAFDPIDIDSPDAFPMHLCRYFLPWSTSMMHGPSCVGFGTAVQHVFPEEFTANMLNMISVFDKLADKTLFPPTFLLVLAFVRYSLHRLSLSSSLDTDTNNAINQALRILWSYIDDKNLPDDQVTALSDLVEDIVIHSPVFEPGPEWTGPQVFLVEMYSVMVSASPFQTPGHSPKHDFWPALGPLVGYFIHQYDAPYDIRRVWHAPFHLMCNILGLSLRHSVKTAYDVFLETRCLDVFGGYSLRSELVGVINGYVTGLAAPHASINSQRHLDYLHKPENLFLACCILTTKGWNTSSGGMILETLPERLSEDIRRDIRALASLRPSDPSWDHCRRELRDLLQGDGGEFFVKQQKWTEDGFKDLEPEDIDEAKSNIRLALDDLDGFFSDLKNTHVPYPMRPRESRARRFLGRIHQYLRYPRRRERDEVQV